MAGRLVLGGSSVKLADAHLQQTFHCVISHEIVVQFLAETTRREPLNGKRHLEIYLASG